MGELINIAELSSQFYGAEIKRIHIQILDHNIQSGIDKCGADSGAFEFFGDGLSGDQAILCVAEEVGIKVPAYLRDYVIRRDGEYRFDREACLGRLEDDVEGHQSSPLPD